MKDKRKKKDRTWAEAARLVGAAVAAAALCVCARGERVPPPPARRAARPPARRFVAGGRGHCGAGWEGERQRESESVSASRGERVCEGVREERGRASRVLCAREREGARECPCGSVGRVRVRVPG